MRVCFYHAGAEWSGRARVFAEAADELLARGYEVTLVCARGSAVERSFGASGHEVIALRLDGGWFRVAWRLRGVLRRRFVEVVFVHTEREQLEAAAAVRLADRGAVVRRVPPLGRLTLGGDARLGVRCAATGFLFAFDEDLRSARPPSRALEPVVAPPGVAHPAQHRGGVPTPGTRSIACIFDASQRARVATALRATALLAEHHPELRLALVGPRLDEDVLRIQAAALGIGNLVEFVADPANRVAVQERIATAEIGWVVAEGDDAVFAVLDCFAAGVPVVSERNPLSARLVQDGETGALTTGLDAAGHAALLAAILADHERRARLSHAALGAAARWPMDAMAAGFERATEAARDRSRWRV